MLHALSAIHHCVSLGPTCSTAEYLRSQNLRQYALPFDWLHSDEKILCDCLSDGCSTLLQRRNLHSSTARWLQ